jgi:hypothetical protein
MPRSAEPINKSKKPIRNAEWPTALLEPLNVSEATSMALPTNMSESAAKDTRKPAFPSRP